MSTVGHATQDTNHKRVIDMSKRFSTRKLALHVLLNLLNDKVYFAVLDDDYVNECASDLFEREIELTDEQQNSLVEQYSRVSEMYLHNVRLRIKKEIGNQ